MGIFDSESSSTQFGQDTAVDGSDLLGSIAGAQLGKKATLTVNTTVNQVDPELIDASVDIVTGVLDTSSDNLSTVIDFAGDVSGAAIDAVVGANADSLDFAVDVQGGFIVFADDASARAFDFSADTFEGSLDFASGVTDSAFDIVSQSAGTVLDAIGTIQARESGNTDARLAQLAQTAVIGVLVAGTTIGAIVFLRKR